MAVITTITWLLIFLPLLAGLGMSVPRFRDALIVIAPWTALPALIVATLPNVPEAVTVPWLLLESRFGLELETRIFLFFTALLWIVGGEYATTYMKHDRDRHQFWFFFLMTMTGNLGLIVSQDVASFYVCFTLMTFAGYGLIVHDASEAARRAGKIYIIMAVLGEVMLIASFIILSFEAGSITIAALAEGVQDSPYRMLVVGLLIGGFGVKAGVIPLHMWLPLAHPVAPTPASAVLSGAMIKAGLLGWLRFLPLGELSMPTWGALTIAVGIGAAFAAAIAGVFQQNPKTVLAYSSISQMGIISSSVGVVMIAPETWKYMATAIAFYALHHGIAKGALFLGVGVAYSYIRSGWQRNLVNTAMLLPALALAGAPLTSGAAAKSAIKDPLKLVSPQWEEWLTWLLLLAAVGTTVLMTRFLYLIRPGAVGGDPHHPFEAGLWAPWAVLLVSTGLAALVVPWHYGLVDIAPTHLAPAYLWQSIWPIMIGLLLSWATNQLRGQGYGQRIRDIPPGDILVLVEAASARIMHPIRQHVVPSYQRRASQIERARDAVNFGQVAEVVLGTSESFLVRFRTAGTILIALMTLLFLLVRRW